MSHRRALAVGIAVSAVVHVLAVVLYPLLEPMRPAGAPPTFISPGGTAGGEGMQVVRLREVPATEARPTAPEEVRPVEAPPISPGVPDVSDTNAPGLVAPSPGAAERLRPHLSDPRLWAPLDPTLNELTLEQRLELDLAGRIVEWEDSMAAIAEARRAMNDWTVTDKNGGKWGVSEGKLHLGNLTLPLPFAFGTPVGKRDEAARAKWEWDEIQRGAATAGMRESWKERAKAIRERRDKERAAKTKPDTSGVGR